MLIREASLLHPSLIAQLHPNRASQWSISTQKGREPRQQADSACPNGVQRPLARLFDTWPSDSYRHDCWLESPLVLSASGDVLLYIFIRSQPMVDLSFGEILTRSIWAFRGRIPPDPGCQDSWGRGHLTMIVSAVLTTSTVTVCVGKSTYRSEVVESWKSPWTETLVYLWHPPNLVVSLMMNRVMARWTLDHPQCNPMRIFVPRCGEKKGWDSSTSPRQKQLWTGFTEVLLTSQDKSGMHNL